MREITRREMMFEMKEVLEGMAARLLARRGEVPELDILRENVRESETAALTSDSDPVRRPGARVPPDDRRRQRQPETD